MHIYQSRKTCYMLSGSLFLSPSDSTTRTNEELHLAVIVGGILGPLAFALIIIICVTVTCLIWRRKRTNKSLSHSSAAQQPLGSNPVYEGILITA